MLIPNWVARRGRFWLPLLTVSVLGCSDSGPAPTYPVTGTVKLPDGTPLAGGQILFRPEGDAKYPARADLAADGTFTLSTFEPGDGAIAGEHQVTINPAVPPELMENARAMAAYKPPIDPKYGHLRSSPLEYTVAADGSPNHFDIVVEPPRR